LTDHHGARTRLPGPAGVDYYRLARLADMGLGDVSRLPVTVRVLLEGVLRHAGGTFVGEAEVAALAGWPKRPEREVSIPYMPARVLMQDFTGVPAAVDLAALRSAVERAGGDAARVDPLVPADLVIDHSVQVDAWAQGMAFVHNVELEYQRNHERYALLRWAQSAFGNFRVVPPGMGICHQVNLEYLARVVQVRSDDKGQVALPDTLVGTDSHTPMVNGLGVLGWGVGGIEAEAVLLGQPLYLPFPQVVGMRLSGSLPAGATATDLVLALTEMLRKHGVVGRFVEFCGAGLSSLSLPDRATLSNMSPEYGATSALFPVDQETLRYLDATGREPELIDLVERYTKEQGLFRTDDSPIPQFDELLELNLSSVEPSLAGPRRPQDRVSLPEVGKSFHRVFGEKNGHKDDGALRNGSVVIAAITSCTNTSNPSVMVAAGLLAKRAVERGLKPRPWVKTSMAPGSRVVTRYLERAGLLPYLEQLGFGVVGYGCTTCIGNSGPLSPEVATAVKEGDLSVVAVLSGNRNFEGRIHPQVRASYLGSPPLVVAYALAGDVDVDLSREPLGEDTHGRPVLLSDLWPSADEVVAAIRGSLGRELFTEEYARIFDGDERWAALDSPTGALYRWDPDSTYVREPPFFSGLDERSGWSGIKGARVLAVLGDSVTTDHISPAGSIPPDSPAGRYLLEHGVAQADFNSYGSRRGNHEVMLRGTFANIRLRNALVPEREGWWTLALPGGEVVSYHEAAERYRASGTPLIVLAGREYGSGSSRDWAAKGPALLGVRGVIAHSYERIHRSNLVAMGVLPLQFADGDSVSSLGLSGREVYDVQTPGELRPGQTVKVLAQREDGSTVSFDALARVDAPVEVEYIQHGGILPMMLARMLS
jgi:aconitate hydratase